MNQDNVFAYIKERDLHEHYMKMLEPEGDLWRGISCTDKSNNEDFKRGAVWSIAWFLISACANCKKVYLQEQSKTNLDIILEKIVEKNTHGKDFDTTGFCKDFKEEIDKFMKEEENES